jgi:hypothetical protein
MIGSNAARYVDAPRPERFEMTFLEPDQVERLASVIDPRYRVLVWFLVLTGVRFGELVALETKDLDMLRRTVNVSKAASEVRGRILVGPPRPPQDADKSPTSHPWSKIWGSTLAFAKPERVWCFRPPRVATCVGQPGENESGSRRSTPQVWKVSGSTISGTQRWHG